MKKLIFTTLIITILMGLSTAALAAEEMKQAEKWVDITKAILANPATKGGWVEDPKGKVFRSEDGNSVKVIHSTFGTYVVNLVEKKVYRIVDGARKLEEGTTLIQRDFGTSLVIKSKAHKFRLKFKEAVAGMKHIEGIKGM